jgi:hypothetical protein
MAIRKPDIKPDINAAKDRGETVFEMEPLLIGSDSEHRRELTDLAVKLAQKSAGFRRSLPDSLLSSLADLVRAMNWANTGGGSGYSPRPMDRASTLTFAIAAAEPTAGTSIANPVTGNRHDKPPLRSRSRQLRESRSTPSTASPATHQLRWTCRPSR